MPTRTRAALLALQLAAAPLAAQAVNHRHEDPGPAMADDDRLAASHLRLTPAWPARPGDRARADSVAELARTALARYADVKLAEADGYRMFAPGVTNQPIYHYSRAWNAVRARRSFDPARPSALLYRPGPDGRLTLVGAMYTAGPEATLEELDARIPLSIARWHQHTSICLPPGRAGSGDEAGLAGSLAATDPHFGPRGTIATETECTAAGGEFRPRLLGWMVHANLFDGSPDAWGHAH